MLSSLFPAVHTFEIELDQAWPNDERRIEAAHSLRLRNGGTRNEFKRGRKWFRKPFCQLVRRFVVVCDCWPIVQSWLMTYSTLVSRADDERCWAELPIETKLRSVCFSLFRSRYSTFLYFNVYGIDGRRRL